MRIALSQANTTVGDIRSNARKIIASMEEARQKRADLVVFPELVLCGYPPEDLLLRPGFIRECQEALSSLITASEGIAALVGLPHLRDGTVYNAAALIHRGTLVDVYHKVELPNYGVFDERRYFHPGESPLFFCMEGTLCMVTICEDIWISHGPVEQSARENHAQVILNLSSSPFHAGKFSVRQGVIARFAAHTGALVCHTNMVGGQDELVFDGGSFITNSAGETAASARRFAEDLLIVDMGPLLNVSASPAYPPSRARAGIYLLQTEEHADRGSFPAVTAPELGRLEEIHQALLLGTRDYVVKNGFEKVVVGLSGGIDSALTVAIAVEALGRERVVAVTMPSEYTSKDTFADAGQVASNLGIPLLVVPIDGIFSSYREALRGHFGPGRPGIEYENIQARIRGTILMALSNRFGWLVLTTGNKSEIAVGYCTLYGDMAGGFAVIKDLSKGLVYEMARYINERKGQNIIPEGVLMRAPSAELRPDQRDEDSLPPYALLDPILKAYVEDDMAPGEIAGMGFLPEMANEVIRMVDRSEYKRRQAPPGIKITPKAFGKDRRLPITNRYAR
ncbi:MAG: NAD+ synthase [bacterium]